ncbi:hypothetical protein GCM10011374_34490 [Kocuria dechangensis]|uniref:DUF8175 domain-containing protein n=1 Tax=Kocuria dechangensis TaxID=1176249 RepID=A0A917H4Q1_9MICC|nr:hypothetical protein [Kocuria dechangensis]GGG67346.1 hypothetical protein GCM10011374_34490 [Kocuria dechangensis]
MMDTHDNDDATRTRPRWFGPALIALVLLLVAVTGWTIRNLTSTDDIAAQTPAAPTATASTQEASEEAIPQRREDFAWDCQADLNTDTGSVAKKAPEVQDWVAAGYTVVPSSPEFGGCERRDSGLRVGFAHSEAGALMAAATYAMALDPSVSEEAGKNIEVGIAEGPNRDRLEEKAQRIRDGVEEGDDGSASASTTLIGYSQDHYTDQSASYQLIYDLPSDNGLTTKVAVQADVVWEDGDWKLDPASGTELMTSDQYQGQPYVQWGPKS